MRPAMTRGLAVAAAVAATLSACDGGSPAPRGYGSRQILHLRETQFFFVGGRGDIIFYSIGTIPKDSLYYTLDLRTGAVTPDDGSFSSIPYPEYTFPSDPNARYHCSYFTDVGNVFEFRIDDGQTGQRTTISGGTYASGCPTESDPTLKIWRGDGAGHTTLWTGPYDNLQMAPVDLTVRYPFGTFDATSTTVTVLAGRPDQPDALGIYAIDLTTFAVTELVAPVLAGAAWADGATPVGVLDSSSLDSKSLDAPLALGDHFLYSRVMADGGTTMFVGPLAAGAATELALFSAGATMAMRSYLRSTTGAYVAPAVLPTWQQWADTTMTGSSDLLFWDDARQRVLTCPSAFTSPAISVLSDDHTTVLTLVASTSNDPSFQPTGPLKLVDLTSPATGDAACTTVAASDVNAAGLSPDGSTMFWLTLAPYPDPTTQLFFAAPDGSGARLVDHDRIEGQPDPPRFVGPSQLELQIFGDLVWADVHDDPLVAHPIADRTLGGAIDRGRWLIIGYDQSEQDGTATLGLVNRDTGKKKPISPDVDAFFTPDLYDQSGQVVPSPLRTADDPVRIVYMVRGRNPSSQDGIWVANIYPSDTP